MSDEKNLNPKLREVELSLKSTVLPPVELNRDELMYQAGWAAAVASSAAVSVERQDRAATPQARKMSSWGDRAWPAVAVISSSAAILLASMLMFPGDSSTNAIAHRLDEMPLQIKTNSTVEIVNAQSPADDFERSQDDELFEIQQAAFADSRQSDFVHLVMSMQPGQILTSGLGVQGTPISFELAPDSADYGSEGQSTGLNQRQLLNELLAPAEPFENTSL